MEYMNIREVADFLRLHPNTVYRLCKQGDIPSIKFGTTIRVHKDDLSSYLATK
jgi:excisionase family DNA binding protein